MFLRYFICGLIVAIPFVFPSTWILSWFALIPLAFMLIRHGSDVSKKRAYMNGFAFGLGYFGVMFYWFTSLYPMEFLGLSNGESLLLVIVCWFGLALVQTIEFGFLPLIYRLIKPDKKSPVFCILLVTALFVIFEWQQNFFWRGVPWARLAVSQSAVPIFQQSASLLGGLFVSGLIAAVNAFLALALYNILGDRQIKELPSLIKSGILQKKTVIFTCVALAIFLSNALFGAIRYSVYDVKSDRKVTCAAIQGNISSLDKWADDSVSFSLKKYTTLTRKCVEETSAQIVVWPETVICTDLANNRYKETADSICKLAKELNITIFVGAFESEWIDDEKRSYNSVFLFKPDGTMDENTYRKRHLVPFGEYTPMEDFIKIFLPILFELNILSDTYTPGTDSEVFDTVHGKVGSLVCFDSIYELTALDSTRDGAELLTLSTNDSWFRDSAAVYQHNSHASIRAIENGRYIVRAANTGVSTVISPVGDVLVLLDPLIEGYVSADAYMLSSRTLYSYVGDIFVYVCISYAVGLSVYLRVKNKRA